MSDGTPGDGIADVTPSCVARRVCELMGWPRRSYDYLEHHCRAGTAHPEVVAKWKLADEQARKL